MSKRLQAYYEQPELWVDYPEEKDKVQEIIQSIPSEVQSILDVGCGNGNLVNTIVSDFSSKFKPVVGMDISTEALKYVRSEKFLGGISQLPFKDSSFDLVIASEVLEHLPYSDLREGISEIQRVSNRYIIITVPNDEDLESDLRCCPNCFCWFNKHFHMNSFNKSKLNKLFNQAQMKYIKKIGPDIEYISYNNYTRLWFNYQKKYPPASFSICPQCGHQLEPEASTQENNRIVVKNKKQINPFRLVKILFKPFRKLIYKIILPRASKKRWLLAVFDKNI